MIGNLIISKAGHDKSTRYIIIKEDNEYVYVADGRLKTVERPKKKNKKHMQPVSQYDTGEIKSKLLQNQAVSNEEIKYVIKQSIKNVKNKEERNV